MAGTIKTNQKRKGNNRMTNNYICEQLKEVEGKAKKARGLLVNADMKSAARTEMMEAKKILISLIHALAEVKE